MSGLTGHINHLYEDPNLKLSDIIRIYRSISENSQDIKCYEKIDGLNIYLSVNPNDRKVRVLRNKSQIKNCGLTIEQLKQSFTEDRIQNGKEAVPFNVVRTYTDFLEFFETIFNKVFTNKEEIQEIFGLEDENQSYYFNVEIVDPNSPNVIKYNSKRLVFHKLGNIKVSCETGDIISVDDETVNERYQKLSSIFGNSTKSDGIEISGDLPCMLQGINKNKLETCLSNLLKEFKAVGLDMSNTIGEFFVSSIDKKLSKEYPELSTSERVIASKYILSCGFGSKHVKKPSFETSLRLKNLLNENKAKSIFDKIKETIENELFNCSSILLDRYKSSYITNNKQTADDIINIINKSIDSINVNGSDSQKERMHKNLNKLRNSTISFEKLIDNPIEGIVFEYKDRTYKITSSFGPVNQIVNMIKYSKQNLNESNDLKLNGIKVLFAGSFKPPHKGHIEILKNIFNLKSIKNNNLTIEKVIVFIGNKSRFSNTNQEFNYEQSIKIFNIYLRACGLEKFVELRLTARDNPVKDVYEYITNENNDENKAQPGDVILLAVSGKDKGYYSNLGKYVKDKPWQILFGEEYELPTIFKNERENIPFSSREFRNEISKQNIDNINSYLPDEVLNDSSYLKKVYELLGINRNPVRIEKEKITNLIDKRFESVQATRPAKLNLKELINRVNIIYNK